MATTALKNSDHVPSFTTNSGEAAESRRLFANTIQELGSSEVRDVVGDF
jgi:hypothetical protein